MATGRCLPAGHKQQSVRPARAGYKSVGGVARDPDVEPGMLNRWCCELPPPGGGTSGREGWPLLGVSQPGSREGWIFKRGGNVLRERPGMRWHMISGQCP